MAGKKKVAPPPKPVLKVLTVVKVELEDVQDLESLKDLVESVHNVYDPVFRGAEGMRGAVIYIDWMFELKDTGDLEALNEYAAEVEGYCWDFSMGDHD